MIKHISNTVPGTPYSSTSPVSFYFRIVVRQWTYPTLNPIWLHILPKICMPRGEGDVTVNMRTWTFEHISTKREVGKTIARTMMRAFVVLALAVSVSARASAFVPGSVVKNVVGEATSRTPFAKQ